MFQADRKVIAFTLPGWEYCRNVQTFREGKDYDRIDYVSEYLGEYSINWLMCYKGGQLVKSVNVKYVESLEYETGESVSHQPIAGQRYQEGGAVE